MQLVIALKIPRKHGKKSSGRDLLYKLPPIHEKKKKNKKKGADNHKAKLPLVTVKNNSWRF